jgi:fibronectin type 3 domain-containing protein
VSWSDNSDNESGFKIYRSTGGTYSLVQTVGSNVTSCVNTGLSSGITYYYKVKAYNAYGESYQSNVDSAVPSGVPTAPTGCTAMPGCGRVTISWSNVSSENGYKIYRSIGGGYSYITSVGANITSYINTGLSTSYTYYYKVLAYNSCGNSGYSNVASAQPLGTPSTPSMLSATAVSSSQINISWSNVGGESGYKIYRNGSYICSKGANVTSYSNYGLSASTTYCYTVRSYSSCGTSGYSNEKCATTQSDGGGGDDGGGCPFVYTWDGGDWLADNNLLPTSEDATRTATDVTDYYLLRRPLEAYRSEYRLQIREFEKEHTWIDQVKLKAVDHDPDVKVGVTPDGRILTYARVRPPLKVTDGQGVDCTEILETEDHIFFEGQKGDELTLTFGPIPEKKKSNKAVLILSSQAPEPVFSTQTKDKILVGAEDGDVKDVTAGVMFRHYMATQIIDATPWMSTNEEWDMTLQWQVPYYLDWVGLSTNRQREVTTYVLSPLRGEHSNGDEVMEALLAEDGTYAELVPGQTIEIAFPSQRESSDLVRDFVFVCRGHYIKENQLLPTAAKGGREEFLPTTFVLGQNYPNPFNPETEIGYQLPLSGEQTSHRVTLKVYNVLGQEVRTLTDAVQEAGYHTAVWDSRDNWDRDVPSGVYFYRLRVNGDQWSETKRMVLLR